jgi:hypothetical protein
MGSRTQQVRQRFRRQSVHKGTPLPATQGGENTACPVFSTHPLGQLLPDDIPSRRQQHVNRMKGTSMPAYTSQP